MSVLERVKEAAETLTPAEQLLIKQVITNPRDIALGTASGLAQRIGVHEATASRLAKKLGYPNYAGFRAAIQEEFIVRTDPATRVRNTLQQTSEAGLVTDLVSREIEALAGLQRYVDDATLLAAAHALLKARRIYVFARGNAEALAVLIDRRLRRMGRDTVLLAGEGRDLAEQVLGMDSDDAIIAFAFRRQPTHYGALLNHARAKSATSVVVSGSVGPSLVPAADHLLFAPRTGSQDAFQTLTVPMAICNALVLAMAKEDPRASFEYLETLGQLIDAFD
ncbi:DNA-binding transcriptional regulator, MurR/RpiR family, contains HTH and SIS domains [Devosia crocina]|uniref:DNA-binding transcriptional regulator, MurR/RpiR family, contains HTH and SIS domains n=1 Tax=Devosia crocina TaxID=429728 RepID=A0A1I7NVU9_9HYPH|nr:MurR/RpiR family transcriptional regulator [Devosia crocina]SFV38789.1 DNA-binding transcriptional regulator, MurR/RpiR family, contains HTH and SIS domains [Devosia crocina]